MSAHTRSRRSGVVVLLLALTAVFSAQAPAERRVVRIKAERFSFTPSEISMTAGEEIEITRHGRPVAVLISIRELKRLRAERPRFADAYQRFLAEHSLSELDIDSDFFDGLRDRGAGRKVVL